MDSSYMWYAGRRKNFFREPYPGQSLRRKMFLAKSDYGTNKGACADVKAMAISCYSLAKESLLSCAEPCNSWKNRGKESRRLPPPSAHSVQRAAEMVRHTAHTGHCRRFRAPLDPLICGEGADNVWLPPSSDACGSDVMGGPI